MDAVEFTRISAALIELGSRLNELRAKRAEIDKEIVQLETEIRPLILQQSQMVAEIVGTPPAATAGLPAASPSPVEDPNRASPEIRRRILDFLRKADEGISALEIAEALRIDSTVVRNVMREWARSPGE